MSLTFQPENSIEPAFSYFPEYAHGIQPYPGLTKREYAAIKIMAGFAADQSVRGSIEDIPTIAKFAVVWTDALFNELDKTEG